MRRIIPILLLAAAASAAACSDPLEGIGDLSRRVVHGSETAGTTSTAPIDLGPVVRLAAVTDAAWMNDGLDAGIGVLSRDALIATIRLRGEEGEDFVQASRREIAAALPGIEFPRLVPGATEWISSQLFFDPQTGTLDPATSAAFGMWSVEPYTAPRNEAQLAVLRVGVDTLEGSSDGDYASFLVSGGRELTWTRAGYVYQLFCRTGVGEDACFAIAESTTTLEFLSGAGTGA
jgi:hypothetical protein